MNTTTTKKSTTRKKRADSTPVFQYPTTPIKTPENEDTIWIASFDIGKKNFALYIEEVDMSLLKNSKIKYESIKTKPLHNLNNSLTDAIKPIYEEIFVNGKTILHLNTDISSGSTSLGTSKVDTCIFYNMLEHLNKYKLYFDHCSYFVIEEQMKCNPMAMKLAQHCFSYFCFSYDKNGGKKIVEFPSYHKTSILGAPKTEAGLYKNGKTKYKAMDKPARKKWAIEQACAIFEKRGELIALNTIQQSKKKDDFSDTVCQLNAFKIFQFII